MPRVALVDDDIEFLDELADHLSAAGYSVSVWHRPALAWRFVRRERPEALLLDFDMPGVSGLQILQRLRAHSETRSIPVLLLTAHDHPEVRAGGWSHQLDDFIPKGTALAEIRLRLARAVERYRENQANASTSGLPARGTGRTRFARALRDDAPEFAAANDARPPIVFALQLAGLERVSASDRPEMYPVFSDIFRSVAHRVRDVLGWPGGNGADPELAPAWERDSETIFFCAVQTAPKIASDTPGVAQILRRRIRAANRLLGRAAGGQQNYLVPEQGRLVRRLLPTLRLHEFRSGPGSGRDLERLLALVSEILDSEQTPPGHSVHDL